MKKTFLLLINILIINQLSFSQSTTILPNRLSVPNVSANGTCDNSSKGSTIFNTTDNKMYYCNGTNWQEMTGGGFTLPYSATQNIGSPNAMLNLKNTGLGFAIYGESTGGGKGIYGTSNSGYGVFGESNSGYGGFFISDGVALGISGKFSVGGNIGTTGSTIANNGGYPFWQDPVAFAVKGNNGADISVPNANVDVKIPFNIEEYDLGNNFDLANSEFTAPVKGIYHFDGCFNWNQFFATTAYSISLKVNNIHRFNIPYTNVGSSGAYNPVSLSTDILLNAGEKVILTASYNLGGPNSIRNSPIYLRFSGRLVIRQ